MKTTFALIIELGGSASSMRGGFELSEHPSDLMREDGEIFGKYCRKMKLFNTEVDVPVESREDALNAAQDKERELSIKAIELKAEELERMKTAFAQTSSSKSLYIL